MTTKHRNLSEIVRDYLARHPGQRFNCYSLARQFDVSYQSMRRCLDGLTATGTAMSDTNERNRVWFIPSTAEVQQREQVLNRLLRTREFKPLQMNPVLLAQGKQAQLHRAQYPSGPSGKVQEMSELDRNKLAMIGSSN